MTTTTAKRVYFKDTDNNILIPHAASGVVDSNTHGTLTFKTCTRAEYDALYAAGTLEENMLYHVTDDTGNAPGVLPLFTPMWQDYKIKNTSWLRADTFSWQSGAVYVGAYEHLLNDLEESGVESATETIGSTTITYYKAEDGHKIVLADQETNVLAIYNETGVAWYYIVDTENNRFKLPRTKFAFTGLRNVVGSYVEAGLPDINGSVGGVSPNIDPSGAFSSSGQVGPGIGAGAYSTLGINFKASDSNSVYGNSDTVQQRSTQMYLYMYMGDTNQTPEEIDVSTILSQLNEKVDIDLSNVDLGNISSAFKSNLVNWFAPDYTAGVSVTSGDALPVTALVVLEGMIGSFGTLTLSVNGETVWSGGVSEDSSRMRAGNVIAGKGDVITFNNGTCKYYPLLGASL